MPIRAIAFRAWHCLFKISKLSLLIQFSSSLKFFLHSSFLFHRVADSVKCNWKSKQWMTREFRSKSTVSIKQSSLEINLRRRAEAVPSEPFLESLSTSVEALRFWAYFYVTPGLCPRLARHQCTIVLSPRRRKTDETCTEIRLEK